MEGGKFLEARFSRWNDPVPEDAARLDPEQAFEAGLRNHHISNTAYPISHSHTWGPYRLEKEEHLAAASGAFADEKEILLYAHIPFCEVRCAFCEYTVVGKAQLDQDVQYMGWLLREFEMWKEILGPGRVLGGFDIGGGTPSMVDASLIDELVSAVRGHFPSLPQISIETTPKIAAADPGKMLSYFQSGIRRISMGIQVTQKDLLREFDREIHGPEHHRTAVDNIREAGFRHLNLDLMYGFANQSLENWRDTLMHAIALDPEYITLYRMRYKLTRISHQAGKVTLDKVREQAALAKKLLSAAGYLANPGKNTYSRLSGDPGTSEYLTRRLVRGIPYIGMGLGAQSFSRTTISYNDGSAGKNLIPYRRSIEAGRIPFQDLYWLPKTHMMAKMIAVSFYFGEVDLAAFRERFGCELSDEFGAEMEFVRRKGLMEEREGRFSLTEEGARHFNGVIALFFAPSVQQVLAARDPDTADDMEKNRRQALAAARSTMK